MTIREQAKQLLPLIQAMADGKSLQVKDPVGWVDFEPDRLIFCPGEYRIKPALKEGWVDPDLIITGEKPGDTLAKFVYVRQVA